MTSKVELKRNEQAIGMMRALKHKEKWLHLAAEMERHDLDPGNVFLIVIGSKDTITFIPPPKTRYARQAKKSAPLLKS